MLSAYNIAAHIVDSPGVRKLLGGRGVVEEKLDNRTYVIRLESGKMTVRLDKGSLPVNTPVSVTSHGSGVDIRVIHRPMSAADGIALSGRAPDSAAEPRMRQVAALLDQIAKAARDTGDTGRARQQIDTASRALRAHIPALDGETAQQARRLTEASEAYVTRAASGEPVAREIRNLAEALMLKLAPPPPDHTGRTVTLSTPLQPGFMAFASAREAAQWLGPHSEGAAGLDKLDIRPGEPVVVRVAAPSEGTQQAVVAPRQEAALEIRQFLTELQSPAWRAVSPEALLAELDAQGAVATERLRQIDALLVSHSELSQQLSRIEPETIRPMVEQWLSVVLESDVRPESLAQRVPAYPATDITRAYEQLVSLLSVVRDRSAAGEATQEEGAARESATERVSDFDTRALEALDAQRHASVAQLFAKLGLDTEQRLVQAHDKDASPPDNLKMRLLAMLGAIEEFGAQRGRTGDESTAAAAQETVTAQSPEVAEAGESARVAIQALVGLLERVQGSGFRVQEGQEEVEQDGAARAAPSASAAAEQVRITRDAITLFLNTLSEVSPTRGTQAAPAQSAVPVSTPAAPPPAGEPASVQPQPTASPPPPTAQTPTAEPSPPPLPQAEPGEMMRVLESLGREIGRVLQETQERVRGSGFRVQEGQGQGKAEGGRFVPLDFEPAQPQPETAAAQQAQDLAQLKDQLVSLLRSLPPLQIDSETLDRLVGSRDTKQASLAALGEIMDTVARLSRDIMLGARAMVQSGQMSLSDSVSIQAELARLVQQVAETLRGFALALPAQIDAPSLEELLLGIRMPAATGVQPDIQALAAQVTGPLENIESALLELAAQGTDLAAQQSGETRSAIELILPSLRALLDSLGPQAFGQADQAQQPLSEVSNIVNRQVAELLEPFLSALRALGADISESSESIRAEASMRVGAFVEAMLSSVRETPEGFIRGIEQLNAMFSPRAVQGPAPQTVEAALGELSRAIDSLPQRGAEILDSLQNTVLPLLEDRLGRLGQRLEAWQAASSAARVETSERLPGLAGELREEFAQIGDVSLSPKEAQESAARAAETVERGLAQTSQRFEELLAQVSRAFDSSKAEFLEGASRQFRDTAALVENALRSFTTAMRMAVSESAQRLGDLVSSLQEDPESRSSVFAEAREVVRDLSGGIQRLLDRAGVFMERLLTEPSVAEESRMGEVQHALERLVSQLGRDIEAQGRSASSEVEDLGARAALSADSSGVQTLAQEVENALTRLESLQLLARSAVSPDGQQQILSLPVNIAGEWTEVTVRLVRRHAKRSGPEQGDFSVYMNVAPAFLGTVDVNMRYTKHRDLGVNIDFERPASRAWFAANRDAIHGALEALGFKNVRLSLRMARPEASLQPAHVRRGASDSTFDITV